MNYPAVPINRDGVFNSNFYKLRISRGRQGGAKKHMGRSPQFNPDFAIGLK